jgi:uncharacterized protein HemY
MNESDTLFRKGMEMLRSGEYKKAEELFCRAKELAARSQKE